MAASGPVRPPMPDPSSPAGKPRGSLVPVAFVLACLIGFALLVVACAGPAGLYVLLAVCGVVAFVFFHYLLWGVWLAKRIRDDQGAEDDFRAAGKRDQ
jgi:hypothetical protein